MIENKITPKQLHTLLSQHGLSYTYTGDKKYDVKIIQNVTWVRDNRGYKHFNLHVIPNNKRVGEKLGNISFIGSYKIKSRG